MTRIICAVFVIQAATAEPCSDCHRSQAAAHARTNHARALHRPAGTAFAAALPDRPLGEARGGFLLSYTPDRDALRVKAERGDESAEGRIEWILGAGDQGMTPLVRAYGRWLEHRISYYTEPGRFDLTLGHAPGPSRSAKDALGTVQAPATAQACLSCHATVDTAGSVVEPGVTCERCHAASAKHFQNPARLNAREQVRLCATCHRLEGPNDPLAIRFQPLRLVKSRCFDQGGLACLSCHPAHRNAVRQDPSFYRAQCAGCHATRHSLEQSDCLHCHMPKLRPAPYLSFTDHYIRVPARK